MCRFSHFAFVRERIGGLYMAMIEFQDVHKWYGDFHVLNGISEKVEKGEYSLSAGRPDREKVRSSDV